MNLRRCKAATVSAGAISAGFQCECKGVQSALHAAAGESGTSGMMPGWPRRPLAACARAGRVSGAVQGAHAAYR